MNERITYERTNETHQCRQVRRMLIHQGAQRSLEPLDLLRCGTRLRWVVHTHPIPSRADSPTAATTHRGSCQI